MDNKYLILPTDKDIVHFGKGHDDQPPGRGSGRYPWGSGKRPKRKDRKVQKEEQKQKTKEEILKSGRAGAVASIQSDLTNQELREAVERIRLNEELSRYNAQQNVSKWEKAKKWGQRAQDVVNWTSTGIQAWNNFANIYNATIEGDSTKTKLPRVGGGNKKKKD